MSTTRNRFRVPVTPFERAVFVQEYFKEHAKANPEHTKAVVEQIHKLRADFRALKPGEAIMECSTWTQFCKKVLRLTIRAVQYKLKGGNPRWKRRPNNRPKGNCPGYVYQYIEVFFKTADDAQRFADLVGQPITPKTSFMWFPPAEQYIEEVA